jgi:hypothetical protein
MEAFQVAAAALAWFGATLATLSEARRGLAVGLALAGLGLALSVWPERPIEAALLAAAGLLAAGLRLRDGPGGWGVLPPGSTPGIVLSLVVVLALGLLAGTVLSGTTFTSSLAPLAAALVVGARLLTVSRRAAALTAGSALALALAAFGSEGSSGTVLVGGAVAIALGAIPAGEAREAGL